MEHTATEPARRGPVEEMRQIIAALQTHVDAHFATMQRTHDMGITTGHRSMQAMQQGIEARVSQVEQQLTALHRHLPALVQRGTLAREVVATLGGALAGALLVVALGLALGQTMPGRVIPPSAGQPHAPGPSPGK